MGHRAWGIGHGELGMEILKLIFIPLSLFPFPNAHCPMPNSP
jgi:hypothetical protein